MRLPRGPTISGCPPGHALRPGTSGGLFRKTKPNLLGKALLVGQRAALSRSSCPDHGTGAFLLPAPNPRLREALPCPSGVGQGLYQPRGCLPLWGRGCGTAADDRPSGAERELLQRAGSQRAHHVPPRPRAVGNPPGWQPGAWGNGLSSGPGLPVLCPGVLCPGAGDLLEIPRPHPGKPPPPPPPAPQGKAPQGFERGIPCFLLPAVIRAEGTGRPLGGHSLDGQPLPGREGGRNGPQTPPPH